MARTEFATGLVLKRWPVSTKLTTRLYEGTQSAAMRHLRLCR